MADLCDWCGRVTSIYDDGCLCFPCIECEFRHDVGPARAGQPRGQAHSTKDGFVHAIAWDDDAHCFPVCWPYANHEVSLPTTLEYRRTSDPVNCIACIGR